MIVHVTLTNSTLGVVIHDGRNLENPKVAFLCDLYFKYESDVSRGVEQM